MSSNLIFFVPSHTGYAHVELLRSFASFADVHLFVYKWNPSEELLRDQFASSSQVHVHSFSLNNILSEMIEQQKQQRRIVVLLTASLNYPFGQEQYRLFRRIQNEVPWMIDVYSTGHCMYGCESCTHASSHRLPITFTNYIRTKDLLPTMKRNPNDQIVVCPSFSSEEAPFSLLSNREVIERICTFSFPHRIKLHPLTYPSENGTNPLFTLGALERTHTSLLLNSIHTLPVTQTNTLELIEHARVVICDFNSSIPFEALYFNDGKHLLVYQTPEQEHQEDDRREYFHTFHTATQLTHLIECYFTGELPCKTRNSHRFFLDKYEEPDGKEIERLAQVRKWMDHKDEDQLSQNINVEQIKEQLKKEFLSSITQMGLYAFGEYTTPQILQMCYADLHDAFDTLLDNLDLF